MDLTSFSSSNGTTASMFNFGADSVGPVGLGFNVDNDITGELYRCHLCSYSGTSKCQFNAHMDTHFDHKCAFCDYTSRTEGRLKRHIRDFHSEIPPESWAGNRVLKENDEPDCDDSIDGTDASITGSGGNGKNRKYKCKQCEFVATCKQEFWDHSKAHIKSEKLLNCPQCNFVTEYKHHLEYHLRNHFGSKPFKCAKCNYSCVNKSMLNSHMKSHSNIYQYRCADCSYATKYCHSLKLHLRKYQHKPATVLNLDGTPNPYPVIDVYGTRRGPRPKKPKLKNSQNQANHTSLPQTPMLSSPLSPNMLNMTPIPPLIPASMPMGLPFMYPPNQALLHSGLLGQQCLSQLLHLNSMDTSSQPLLNHSESRHFSRPVSAPIGVNNVADLSPLPRSRSSPTNASEPNDTNNYGLVLKSKQLSLETTPLDLSSNKSTSPLTQPLELLKQLTQSPLLSNILNLKSDEQRDQSSSGVGSHSSHEALPAPEYQLERQQSRAQRRKGRASKLNVNQCVQMSDHSIEWDDMSEETGDSVAEVNGDVDDADGDDDDPDHEDGVNGDVEVNHIISKIICATSLLQEILIDMYSLKNDAYH